MRFRALLSFALLCLALLNGCGNANDGTGLLLKKKSAATVANPAKAGVGTPLKLQYCKLLTVIPGSNASFAEVFAGSQICKVDSAYPMVHLKVGMNFPKSGRFCLVPMTDQTFPETCFSATDAMTFNLDASAAGFSAIAIVAEADVGAYKAFANMYSNYAPPRAIALMNTP